MPWRDRRRATCRNARRGIATGKTERLQADVGGAVAHQGKHGKGSQHERATNYHYGSAPAEPFGHVGEQRQKNELPSCRARGQKAGHQTAAGREPSRRDGDAEHERGQSGA